MPRETPNSLAKFAKGSRQRVPVAARIDPAHAEALSRLGSGRRRSAVIRIAIANHVGLTPHERERLIWQELPQLQLLLPALLKECKALPRSREVDTRELVAKIDHAMKRIHSALDQLECDG